MVRRLAPLILGFALAAFAGAAAARDYIVVASTDPAIARGQAFDSGTKVALAPGQTLTLMHASGDLVRLKGAAAGVVMPRRLANQGDADRLAVLKVIVSTQERPLGIVAQPKRTRAGVCPEASGITTLDGIVQVHQGGCQSEAVQALEAWIVSHPAKDAD